MSFQYDQYLARHRANVKRGFDWLSENLPGLMTNTLTAGWNTEFAHDQSKNEPDEYEAYDAYFYGNNRSYEVVQRYQRAWLLHIHRNPHHWQHWVLIHDDMEDGELETVLEMPYDYIIEMICDWWSFSWQSGNLYEIFKWYEEHSKYIKLAQTTKITVEYILDNMKKKLQALQYATWSLIFGGAMNRTTKINILAYASEPDKNYKYEGDIVDYKGKRYFVSLAEERVEFIGIIKEDK